MNINLFKSLMISLFLFVSPMNSALAEAGGGTNASGSTASVNYVDLRFQVFAWL